MQIHPTNWNIHFLASDLRNSTSSVRFRRLSFNPTKEKRQWRLTIAVRFFWSGRRESNPRGQLGKLIPFPTFRNHNLPSDLAVLKTNTVILANVLDEILEKRSVFQPINYSTLKHESRQNGDFRNDNSGAGDENRTRVSSLGSCRNNHYTTPALAIHYNLTSFVPPVISGNPHE